MITQLVISSTVGGAIVLSSEYLRRKKVIGNEVTRKMVHLAHGLVVACWVWVLPYGFIITAEIIFLAVVLMARWLHFMQPLRSVSRMSWGEVFFPLGIIAVAYINPSKEIFLTAVLNLAIADTLAALIGRKARHLEYKVFSQRKTIAGTLAFLVTSLLIGYYFQSNLVTGYSYTALMSAAFAATLAENISPYGSDNLTIPVAVVCLLNFFAPGMGL